MMHILLVNDDGFDSPYLAVLAKACHARGHHVTVVAPHSQQSAKSHAFTLFAPLLVHPSHMPYADAAYRVEGTPVDACRVGMMGLCEEKPDLVISGINEGYNVGLAVFVSGTVGAAREAAFQGLPAMAVSLEKNTPSQTVEAFAAYAVRMGEKLVDSQYPSQAVLNLNAPTVEADQVKGCVMCSLTRNIYKDGYEKRVSPRGQIYFWLKDEDPDPAPTKGSDLDYLHQGYVTCTFLAPEGCNQDTYKDFPLPWCEA